MSSEEYFHHPHRLPKNAPGPFYSLGAISSDGEWCGECLSCMAPEAEAPALLAALDNNNSDTYFVRQPQTAEETERACRAAEVCCVSAIRYGGKDPKVIQRLGAEYCDFEVTAVGQIVLRAASPPSKWWQFWK